MKRNTIIIILLIASTLGLQAQQSFIIGLRGGGASSDMLLTESVYDVYAHQRTLGATYGLSMRYEFIPWASVRLDGGIAQRGAHYSWEDIEYRLGVRYADFRLMGQLNPTFESIGLTPYLAAGPYVALATSGTIDYSSMPTGDLSVPLSNGNFNGTDFGAVVLVGFEYALRCWLVALEAGPVWGLANSFAQKELSGESTPLNNELTLQRNEGERLYRGAEVALKVSYTIPLANKKNHE